jgi:hypothetical protein
MEGPRVGSCRGGGVLAVIDPSRTREFQGSTGVLRDAIAAGVIDPSCTPALPAPR